MCADWGLRLPVKVLTVTTNNSFVSEGFKYFTESFEKANEKQTPMELAINEIGHHDFWELRWRSKILNILPALRCMLRTMLFHLRWLSYMNSSILSAHCNVCGAKTIHHGGSNALFAEYLPLPGQMPIYLKPNPNCCIN